jgi:hypothetical protein
MEEAQQWPLRPVTVLGHPFDPAMRSKFLWPGGCVVLVRAYTGRPIVFYVDDCHCCYGADSRAAARYRSGVAAAYARAVAEPDDAGSVDSIMSWLSFVERATRAPLASIVTAGAVVLTAVPTYSIDIQRMRAGSPVTVSLLNEHRNQRSVSVLSSVDAAGSLFEDILAAAQRTLIERNLLAGHQRILDRFCFPDRHWHPHTDVLPEIIGNNRRRGIHITMYPRDLCTLCLELIGPSDTPCAAQPHDTRLLLLGIPNVKTCSSCSCLPGAEIRTWNPLLLVPDTRLNKLHPVRSQGKPSTAVAPASVPSRFRTPWQRNAVFLAHLRIVIALARRRGSTDRLSSLPPEIIERTLSLAAALFDMDIVEQLAAPSY